MESHYSILEKLFDLFEEYGTLHIYQERYLDEDLWFVEYVEWYQWDNEVHVELARNENKYTAIEKAYNKMLKERL